MFVNRIPFFASISRHLKFTTADTLHNRTTSQLVQCVTNVKALYTKRGFNVTAALMDGEFVTMRTDLLNMGMLLNTSPASEHVPEIKRQHRVIKERARACRHSLPFKMIPKIMITEMIYNCVLWINAFHTKAGVSASIRPRTLLTGVKFDYKCHCKLAFGAYAQVHEENLTTNSQQAQTLGAICLGPAGNLQGGYKFMNLRTGKKLTRRRWMALPMTQEVIDHVNKLGEAGGQTYLLTFHDRHGNSVGNTNNPNANLTDDALE